MPKDTVLFSSRAPIGHIALAPSDCCTNQGCKSFVANISYIYPLWAYWVLHTRTNDIISRASGTTFKEISAKGMSETWIPLPPIQEQYRIVNRIQELLSSIDSAEIAFSELHSLSETLRQQVLQLAIQGKLVPQLESEPSIDLPSSIPIDGAFAIPKNWKWIKLKNLFTFIDYRGKTPTKIQEGVRLITASNIKFGYMDHSKKNFISNDEYLARKSRGISKKGDILFTTEAPLGNIAIADIENYSAGQRIITLQSKKGSNVLYMYFMLSPYFQKLIRSQATGTTAQGIKAARLKELEIPIPPEQEQERIEKNLQYCFRQSKCAKNFNDLFA